MRILAKIGNAYALYDGDDKEEQQMKINIDGVVREMTEEEENRFRSFETKDEPTQLDIIEAQALYTAMMTGTLIEE